MKFNNFEFRYKMYQNVDIRYVPKYYTIFEVEVTGVAPKFLLL